MSNKIKLDKVDLTILNYLAQNSRISFIKMSKISGIPDATLQNRLHRLVKNKVIKTFTIELNHEYASSFVISIVLLKTVSEKHDKIKRALANMSEVYEVYELFYDFDIFIKVSGTSLDNIDEIIRNKIATIEGVDEARKIAIVEEVKDEHTKWIAPNY
jgi:Lrp/AsnC family transcriptional regulator for asnA, asnC and gidA